MSLFGSLFGTDDASDAIRRATEAGIAETREAYGDVNQLYAPYRESGERSNRTLADLLGLNGQGAMQDARNLFQTTPGYEFRLDEGLDAIENRAASGGMLKSGNTLRGLNEFAQGLASNEYNTYLDRLTGMQGIGLGATQGTANARTGTGQSIANLYGQQGEAEANAALSEGRFLSDLITGGFNAGGRIFGGRYA